jgi:DNA-directed RNA polymerase subunit K/omega
MTSKKLTESRASYIDVEKIIENSGGNRFSMIQQASKRAYELRRGAESKITDFSDPFNSAVVTSLLEIQNA